jgi:hypothetical protein
MNGRPLMSPAIPEPCIVVEKDPRKWVVKERFFYPYSNNSTESEESFEVKVTLLLDKDVDYKVVIEAPELEEFKGVRKDPRDLNADGFLIDYENWTNSCGVTLFRWMISLRDGMYLRPTEWELNGGKSSYQIDTEKWLAEVRKETRYRR